MSLLLEILPERPKARISLPIIMNILEKIVSCSQLRENSHKNKESDQAMTWLSVQEDCPKNINICDEIISLNSTLPWSLFREEGAQSKRDA